MDGFKDVIESALLKIVGASAPLLASALGTPLSSVFVSLLANVFGANPSDRKDLLDKIEATPNHADKIKALEYQHRESLEKISLQDFELETKDKQNARQYGQIYKSFLIQLAVIVTIGFFISLFLLFVIPMEMTELQRTLLSMLVGMLASKWQTIIDFFYGSSHIHSQGETNGSNISK